MANWKKYSVTKATEGGISQKDVREFTESEFWGENIKVRFCYSPYVGQYGVEINTIDKRKLNRFEKKVLGW